MKYEREVFLEVGIWKNFEELEESLTLDELFEIHLAVVERRSDNKQDMANVMGVEMQEREGTVDQESFKRIQEKAKERAGVQRKEMKGIKFRQI